MARDDDPFILEDLEVAKDPRLRPAPEIKGTPEELAAREIELNPDVDPNIIREAFGLPPLPI